MNYEVSIRPEITEAVLQQLRAKHPEREHSVPEVMPGQRPPRVQPLELTEVFRSLRRRAGTGPSGRRNEFLRALVGQFDDARADRVMQLYSEFATMAANAELPRWFYAAWASAGIMPLIKSELTQEQRLAGEDPDCRPVAVGEVDLRTIGRVMALEVQTSAQAHLQPQQLGVAVQGGISILIHGVRLVLELHTSDVRSCRTGSAQCVQRRLTTGGAQTTCCGG